MTGHRPESLRLVPVELVWSGAADVLQTATDAHREMDRLERERPSPHGDEPTNQRGDWQGQTPLLGRAISQSRARKARRHNRIGAAVGVVLLIVCLVVVILAAAGIPIAKADPVDELAATVCHAIAAGGGTADTVLTIIGTGVGAGLTELQAVNVVDYAVLAMCPQYRGALADYARVYGAVVA